MIAGCTGTGCMAFGLLSLLLLASGTAALDYLALRKSMIAEQIRGRGIRDRKVLRAMERVPRHEFVPEPYRPYAYEDRPLPIGEGQTISQPYIVALMTESLGLAGGERVLEVGTGSGYQTAVLAEIAGEVYTVEINPDLSDRASRELAERGYANIRFKVADGYFGWKDHAPYDAVLVSFAADEMPPPLVDQLRDGGRIVIPLGTEGQTQSLMLGEKKGGALDLRKITDVLFVPMLRTH